MSGKINHTGRGEKTHEIAEFVAEVGILWDRVEASISPWNGKSGMQRTGVVTMHIRGACALHAYAFLHPARVGGVSERYWLVLAVFRLARPCLRRNGGGQSGRAPWAPLPPCQAPTAATPHRTSKAKPTPRSRCPAGGLGALVVVVLVERSRHGPPGVPCLSRRRCGGDGDAPIPTAVFAVFAVFTPA